MGMTQTFSASIDSFVKKTGVKAEIVLKKLALDGLRMLILRSPVDTGRFRANWRVGVNTTDLTVLKLDDIPTGMKNPLGLVRTNPPVVQQGSPITAATLDLANSIKIDSAKWGDMIILSNNVHYAGELERGHSRQAPSGVLMLTLMSLKRQFNSMVAQANASTQP